MILQALYQLYGRLADERVDGLPPLNYSRQDISYKIVLASDGSYEIHDVRSPVTAKSKGGKEKTEMRPIQVVLPGDARASERSYTPCVLWDDTRFLFGWHGRQEDQKNNIKCFESFKAFHLGIENEVASPAFSEVCRFLRNWNPRDAENNPTLAELKQGRGVFQIQGQTHYVHDDPVFADWWAKQRAASGEVHGQCLVTGKDTTDITRLHPGIFDIPGVPYTGGSLVSFNDSAYESYGKEGGDSGQGLNSPVSKAAAHRYGAALNWLLASNRQRLRIGDATTVFWTDEKSQAEALLPFLLDSSSSPQDPALLALLQTTLSNISAGRTEPECFGKSETLYYILGLVVNKGRLSVRFWHTSTLGDLAANLQKHHNDLAMVRQWDETNSKNPEPKLPGVYALLKQTARDADGIPPLLGGALMRAILLGIKYPEALFQKVMGRVRVAERDLNGNPLDRVTYVRAAIIKAFLNRNHQLKLTMSLDTTRTETAYLLGRLFAVLEKTQQDALPEINATIRDRYYSGASATPAVVFPRILRTYQHHLGKLEGGHKVNRERLVQEIVDLISTFPGNLNLQQQGQFAIGYYHQRKDFFTKKTAAE